MATAARESIKKLQKKAFVAALPRAQAMKPGRKEDNVQVEQLRPPAGSAIQSLVEIKRFGCLTRLVKTITWVFRAAKSFLGLNRTPNRPKSEAVPLIGVISVWERKDVQRDLFLAAQEATNFPSTTTDRRVVYKEQDSGLSVCG